MAAELEQLRVSLVAELVGREAFEQLRREVNQVRAATSGLDETQTRLRRTTDDAANAVRSQRQAFAQTGMQINQFAGQIAGGTSVMTAFVQQIGDIAYVVGQAGGSMGKLGTFLQGPWAAAILIGISVIGPLIQKLWESKDAAQAAETAFSKYMNSLAKSSMISDAFTENATKIANTKGEIVKLGKELDTLKASKTMVGGASPAAIAAIDVQISRVSSQIAGKKKEVDTLQRQIQEVISSKTITNIQEKNKKIYEDTGAEAERAAKRQQRAYEKAEKAAEKLRVKQEQIAMEIRGFSTKDALDFSKAMEKMGSDAQKAIDVTIGQSLRDNMSEMGPLFERIKEEIDAVVYEGSDKIQSFSENMANSFADGIKGMITGAMSFKDAMSNIINAVINELFRLFVVQQLVGMISGAISGVTGIPLKPKAIGGAVQAGTSYLVGERGPEMFVPSRSGSIVPNKGMSNGMVVNVDARGASDPAAVRAQVEMGIAQAAPYIIAAAQNRTLKTAARTRLPGTIG